MKRIREIESKPSDRVGSTQIEKVTRIQDEYSEIESKPSDHRIGSTQIQQIQMVLAGCVMEEDNCNSAEKRILNDFHEIESNPSYDFKCARLHWNIYEWQFALRGPSGTEFEGGIYHGRIQFPKEYPSKPPSFRLLTENGVFKTYNMIRIWQPSWRVRYALIALIDQMPNYRNGELGSVEYNMKERRDLAIKSRAAAPKFGTAERQKLIDEIHEYLLSTSPPVTVPQLEELIPSQASNVNGGSFVVNDGSIVFNGGSFVFNGGSFVVNGGSLVFNGGYAVNGGCVVSGNTFHATNANRVGIFDSMNAFSDEDQKLLPSWLKLFRWRK